MDGGREANETNGKKNIGVDRKKENRRLTDKKVQRRNR
jgi:hypothetical protein